MEQAQRRRFSEGAGILRTRAGARSELRAGPMPASPTITFRVASWGLEAPTEAWPKAKEAVKKALAADDSLAEAHASMGVIRMWYEWNWKEAEREFLRGIELKPGLPISHVYYNLLLVQTGRFEEAEEQIRLALASDPLSVPANIYLAGVYHYRRDYDRSIEQAKSALEVDANDIEAHVVIALNLEQKKRVPAGHRRAGKGLRTRRPQSADPGSAGIVLRRRRQTKRRR